MPVFITSIAVVIALLMTLPVAPGLCAEPGGKSVLRATGQGSPPAGKSGAQARLLARRAATVDAYRNLLRQLGSSSGTLEKGTGRTSTDGYVKGAFVDEVRYYPDGRVEVVIVLRDRMKGRVKAASGTAKDTGSKEAYEVERPGTVISRQEWESFKAGSR